MIHAIKVCDELAYKLRSRVSEMCSTDHVDDCILVYIVEKPSLGEGG